MIKICLVGENDKPNEREQLKNWFESVGDFELTSSRDDANIVLFYGEREIDPSVYGMPKVIPFMTNKKRDTKELNMLKSVKPNQLVIGIGRGAHLVCIENGGKIIQGCDHRFHNGHQTHPIKGKNGHIYEIPSRHNQLMYPYSEPDQDKYVVLFGNDPRGGYPANQRLNGTGINGDEVFNSIEAEIVLYKGNKEKPKALAIQGRPEIIPGSPVSNMIIKLIKDLL